MEHAYGIYQVARGKGPGLAPRGTKCSMPTALVWRRG